MISQCRRWKLMGCTVLKRSLFTGLDSESVILHYHFGQPFMCSCPFLSACSICVRNSVSITVPSHSCISCPMSISAIKNYARSMIRFTICFGCFIVFSTLPFYTCLIIYTKWLDKETFLCRFPTAQESFKSFFA